MWFITCLDQWRTQDKYNNHNFIYYVSVLVPSVVLDDGNYESTFPTEVITVYDVITLIEEMGNQTSVK